MVPQAMKLGPVAGMAAGLVLSFASIATAFNSDEPYDMVVYGGTSAGVIAAVQARRMGRSVIVVAPEQHLGGLSSGGLGFSDTGNKAVIGGLAREFYHRVWKRYQQDAAWRWQQRDEYGNQGQGTPAIDGAARTMWIFEPHVAERVYEDLVAEHQIPVHRDQWLDRENGVTTEGNRITAIATLDGTIYRGRMFIDATYEGDLMASAGVSYHVGRESNTTYDETWNGVQIGVLHHRHHFGVLSRGISPYRIPGNPASGVLPHVSTEPPGEYGEGDKRIQAYCFRMCLTDHPENRVPFAKPDGYEPDEYELLLRIFDTGWRETFDKFDDIPNRKTDTNNHGPFSTDYIGGNYDYPEASYERRREIIREHERYQKGLMYFIANDPRVPVDVRERMQQWGLAKDEFRDNGNWPHQIYVREARRMKGHFVMTENELLKRRPTPQSVGMGSYTIDSHNVQRYITPEETVQNEGDIGVATRGPYEMSYGALVPRKDECENLLVPVCVSSSHIAFGSMRMEPVFMILGQSAATAASLALDAEIAVQEVDYQRLRERLLSDGQVLEYEQPETPDGGFVDPKSLSGIVVDDHQAETTGDWAHSASVRGSVGNGYKHDSDKQKGLGRAVFQADLPQSGKYAVRISYTANPNRATNVPVTVYHADGHTTVIVDQRQPPKMDGGFHGLGSFHFRKDQVARVDISNADTDGHVIIDAVQWVEEM